MYDLTTLNTQRERWQSSKRVSVALVNRNHSAVNRERGANTQFYSRFPPLGLLNIAACIRSDSDLIRRPTVVRIFEEETYDSVSDLQQAVELWLDGTDGPTMIGATTYTHALPDMEDFLSRFDPSRHLIVVGGAHVTVQPKFDHAHLVVRGEGRAPIRHILNHFGMSEFGTAADAVGLIFNGQGGMRPGRPQHDDSLSTLPSPCFAYDLVDDHRSEFKTHITRSVSLRPQIYVCTQSCRARCTFCSTYLIHGKSKSRDVRLIEADLRELVEVYEHDGFEFWDDDLLQHEQFPELLELLEQLNKKWYCFGRAETIDGELAGRLYRAGCRKIFLGLESMNQERLDYFNKKTTVEQNRRAVEALDHAGIGVIGAYILGAPDDTIASILATYDQYFDLPLQIVSPSILTPDPGTVEFVRARKRSGPFADLLAEGGGRTLKPDLARFGASVPAGLPTLCDNVTKAELNLLMKLIGPHYLLRQETWLRIRRTTPVGLLGELTRYF